MNTYLTRVGDHIKFFSEYWAKELVYRIDDYDIEGVTFSALIPDRKDYYVMSMSWDLFLPLLTPI